MGNIKVVLLNGPKHSGKTTLGKAVTRGLQRAHPDSWFTSFGFADDLKRATHAALGMYNIPFDFFEDRKEDRLDEFLGLSPRQAYIAHSEVYMKQVYGGDVFARLAFKKIVGIRQNDLETSQNMNAAKSFFIMTDCGFQREVETFCDLFGGANILLVQLHRKGKDFAGDSRGYVSTTRCRMVEFHNDTEFNISVQNLKLLISKVLLEDETLTSLQK